MASTAFLVAEANHPTGTRGVLLIDKLGGQIRFVDPVTYKERAAFKVATNPHDFALTADRKTAYVPLYGDGIYGRNPNPGHEVVIVDMDAAKVVGTIDVSPYRAPHGIQIDADGMLYVCSDLDRKLLVIDPKARKVTHAIDTEGTTHWIGILPTAARSTRRTRTTARSSASSTSRLARSRARFQCLAALKGSPFHPMAHRLSSWQRRSRPRS